MTPAQERHPSAHRHPSRPARSPITKPGYRRGEAPPNKGKRLPAELLSRRDVEGLLASFGSSATDVRNKAVAVLAYRAGLKVCDILALERRHAKPGSRSLIVPARARAPEREVTLDSLARRTVEDWITTRRDLRFPPTAPLFCTIVKGDAGNPLKDSYLRQMLTKRAARLAIDRRVSPEGLRHSGKAHRQHAQWSMEASVGSYLEDERFGARYPGASEHWRAALDLLSDDPDRSASRIGHDCRAAMTAFAHEALIALGTQPKRGAGTIDLLRELIASTHTSRRISDHTEALIAYWGAASDLVQRQVHGASHERERLGAEDSRRVVFHTMIVMFEVDRLVSIRG